MPALPVLLQENDRLGVAIEERLLEGGCTVTSLPKGDARRDPANAELLAAASVLVLAADDDAGNVDLALTARRLRPGLPLVVRVFDDALATYLRDTLDRLTILAMSSTAAPAFADAAVRVIAERSGRTDDYAPAAGTLRRAWRRYAEDTFVVGVLAGFAVTLTVFTLFFASALRLSYLDAAYFVLTTVTTVGYGDIALRDAPVVAKLVGMVLMFTGAAFIAVLFGLFTDWVVTRRLDILGGRVRVRGRGHVLIAGGGNVGRRVAERLRSEGHRTVLIERDAASKHVEPLRALGCHVILGDATREDTLSLARAGSSAAVLCLTDSDAVNFQISLLVRAENPQVPIVLRVVSPALSAHVSGHGVTVAISPIAIASEAFADAALALANVG